MHYYIKNKKELADNLKFFRHQIGFTQYEVAKRLDLERSTYAYYESGKTFPSILTLLKITKILQVTANDLLVRQDSS